MIQTNVKKGLFFLAILFVLSSCGITHQIAKQANQSFFANPEFDPAHLGVAVYDPTADKYLYQFQSNKYFVPASNTKLITCYAAMKYLGDSLIGLRYQNQENGGLFIEGTGDPTFLHPHYPNQPIVQFLKTNPNLTYTKGNWKAKALGTGWPWDDVLADYVSERSSFPIYGNLGPFKKISHPLHNADSNVLVRLINDSLHINLLASNQGMMRNQPIKQVYSQATDSMLSFMMHTSDNFFAEQSLLMVSNQRFGLMDERKLIDTLLANDLQGMPQKPKWVDGSGLSRYNLFTPKDFVWILTKMKNEFAWERIQAILPTGGEGTLGNLYKSYAGKIYVKTGTLSNHVALSGFLLTNKGKTLVFSLLVNAHQTSAASIRKGFENFLTYLIEQH